MRSLPSLRKCCGIITLFAALLASGGCERAEDARTNQPGIPDSLAAASAPAPVPAPAPAPATAPGEAPPGMVWIPGGQFHMGSDRASAEVNEGPVHSVYVDGFFMDTYTVTNALFRDFVDATGYVTVAERAIDVQRLLSQAPPGTPPPPAELLAPGSMVFAPTGRPVDLRDVSQWWEWVPGSSWRNPNGPSSSITEMDNFPVVHVAWEDAVAYATWASKRLPTEAEWEFAARGGLPNMEYSWGREGFDSQQPQANIYEGTFPLRPAAPKAVGSYTANPYGLFDMAGNVWQWTSDWYRPDTYQRDHERGVVANPTGPASGMSPREGHEPMRVTRGGSFLCSDSYCRGYRVSARSPGSPDTGTSHIGFRTVMTVEQWQKWKTQQNNQGGSS